jgi:RNA ligase (TIGR02306 family)
LSQGLILPLSILTGYIDEALDGDFSSVLGVQKWEAPVPAQLSGDVVGGFPTGIPKTDEELVQNLGMVFDEYKNYEYEITEKLEGTSSTFFNIDGNFGVCSRNWNMKESENILYWRIANEYELKNIIQDNTIKNIAIQAEICGPKIQNNYYKLNKHKLFVFNIYDIDNSKYFTPKERLDFCIKNNLNHVPILGTISLHDMTIQDIVLMADGISQINSNVIREGVVFKSINSTHHFKSISSKFLLKVG